MFCAKCGTKTVISQSICPQCGSNLLELGATVFSSPSKNKSKSLIRQVTSTLAETITSEYSEFYRDISAEEKVAIGYIDSRLKSLYEPIRDVETLESSFENEILPVIDEIGQDKKTQRIIDEIDRKIKNHIGDDTYIHYKNKCLDVLKILRAGEIAICIMVEENREIDLSFKMFPFFKASEKSSWLHLKKGHHRLQSSGILSDLANWLGSKEDDILISGIPDWLAERKKVIIEVIRGLIEGNEYLISGSMRSGVIIQIFGRDWDMSITRKDLSKKRIFQISNPLEAKGSDEDKQILAEELYNLQKLRNERMHKDLEEDDKIVQQGRSLSYFCLKNIPLILEV